MDSDIRQRLFNAFYDCNKLLLQDEIDNFLIALEKYGLQIINKSNKSNAEDCHGLDDN